MNCNPHKLAARLRAIATKLEKQALAISHPTFNQRADFLNDRAREIRKIADELKPRNTKRP